MSPSIWNTDWFPVPGQAQFDHRTRQVAAVSRTPTTLDLFAIDSNDFASTTFWGPGVVNPEIRLRAIQDDGLFIEVAGTDFTRNEPVELEFRFSAGGAPTHHQDGHATVTSDGSGRFIHRISVTLTGDISAVSVDATDVASNTTVTASIFE